MSNWRDDPYQRMLWDPQIRETLDAFAMPGLETIFGSDVATRTTWRKILVDGCVMEYHWLVGRQWVSPLEQVSRVEFRPAGFAGFRVLSDPMTPPGYVEVRDDDGTLRSRHRIV